MLGLYPMVAIRQRNDPVRLFGRRLMLVTLLVLVVAVVWGVWGAYEKERESTALRVHAEAQLQDFTKRQAQLDGDIVNLQTRRGVEEVLREQYAFAAAGEGLIVIVDQQVATPVQATSTVLDKLKGVFFWW